MRAFAGDHVAVTRSLLLLMTLALFACSSDSPDSSSADGGAADGRVADGIDASVPGIDAGEPGPFTARVMSFNLRWDGFDDGENSWANRRAIVYQVLEAFGPDSVGTQEAMPRQIADIEAAMPLLDSYQFDDGAGFDRTQQIAYNNSRFERVEAFGFLLIEGLNADGTIRFCTFVRLQDRVTGRSYYHYNVHLDHRSATSRQLSAVRLMQFISSRATDDPFVVTGDFNTGESSPTMEFLRGERTLPDLQGAQYTNPLPLVDTYRSLYPNAPDSGTGHPFDGDRTGGKIDHVLVEAGAATTLEAVIIHTEVAGKYPSDHFPVAARVQWP